MRRRQNVLITGATGMLGTSIVHKLSKDPDFNLTTVSRTSPAGTRPRHLAIDLAESESLASLQLANAEVVVHCAALVDVNACESNRTYTHALHVGSTERICKLPSVKRIVYISTDSVFDGKKGDYREGDHPEPLNYYARTKLLGEDVVRDSGKDYIIIRSNMLGFHQPLKNSLFEWGYQSLSQGAKINGFSNVYMNPLYCGDIANLVDFFLHGEFEQGIYHAGSRDAISKYAFLKEIAVFFRFDTGLVTSTSFDPGSMAATRPLNTSLATVKAEALGFPMPTAAETMERLFSDFAKTLIV